MEMLDGTVIVTALPTMAVSFRVAAVDLNVAMTAYLLTLGVFIPVSGWIAERFGARAVFSGAIVLFTVASLLCGLCTTLPTFIAARILQGIGGALMVPVGRLIVLQVTPKPDLMRATATIVWARTDRSRVGTAAGRIHHDLSVLALDILSQSAAGRGGVSVSVALDSRARARHRPRSGLARRRLERGGTCVLLAYGLDLVSKSGESPGGRDCGSGRGSCSRRDLRQASAPPPAPLIDLSVMRYQTFGFNIVSGSLARASIGTAPFLLPLMFQIGMGFSAVRSGFSGPRRFCGKSGDESDYDAGAAPVRLSPRSALERPAGGDQSGPVRVAVARDADGSGDCAPFRQRHVPVDAVHQLGDHRFRRGPPADDGWSERR